MEGEKTGRVKRGKPIKKRYINSIKLALHVSTLDSSLTRIKIPICNKQGQNGDMVFMRHINSNEANVEIKGIDVVVTANTKKPTKGGVGEEMWDEVEFPAEGKGVVKEKLYSENNLWRCDKLTLKSSEHVCTKLYSIWLSKQKNIKNERRWWKLLWIFQCMFIRIRLVLEEKGTESWNT